MRNIKHEIINRDVVLGIDGRVYVLKKGDRTTIKKEDERFGRVKVQIHTPLPTTHKDEWLNKVTLEGLNISKVSEKFRMYASYTPLRDSSVTLA